MSIGTLEGTALATQSGKIPRRPRPAPPTAAECSGLCSVGSTRCSLPGYHLEDKLKDFLWVINKICGWVSEEGLSRSLLCTRSLPARLSPCLQAASDRDAQIHGK